MTSQHNQTAPISHNEVASSVNDSIIQPISNTQETNIANETTITSVPKGSKDVNYNVKASFEVMGIGMLGIFIFMTIFFAMIKLMEKIFPHKEE